MRKKTSNKWTGSVLSAIVVSSLLFPGAAGANSTQAAASLKKELSSSKAIQHKISDSVKKRFEKNDKVTFLIKFKERADTKKAAKAAEKKAKSHSLSAAKTEYQKRSAVVSSLKVTADDAQQNIKTYLEKQKKNGKADHIHSYYIVNGMAVRASKEVMEKVASFPEVEKVLPNEKRQLTKSSVPFQMKKKQKVIKAKDGIEWNISQIDAPKAWALGYDGTGTVVASIDTGVEWDHPALKEKYRGYNPNNPAQPNHEMNWYDAVSQKDAPYDDLDHGTHVTGTMTGSEPDGSNQIGVAPGAKWIAVKAFSDDGGTDADILDAGEWVLAPKDKDGKPHPEMAPDVVNNSWAGGSGIDEWYRDMVKAWRAADIFPEFSAGNEDLFTPGGPGSIANPANYPEAFATGATDSQKKLADFSLQGPSPYNETKPDISAPGVNIRSSVPGGIYEGGWNGTSMAGPHVAATAALLRQANASITVDEMEDVLTRTAEKLTDSVFPDSPNNGYGHGLVNAFDAVSAVTDGIGKIEGQVSTAGEDNEPPVYQHEPVSEAYQGASLPLTVTAEDNVGVTEVTLSYQFDEGEWKTITAVQKSGDQKKGTYQAEIPNITANSVSYKWTIKDFGGHSTESDTYRVSIKPSITAGYKEDFESQPAGWSSYGTHDQWEWGVPISGPGAAVSGEKVYATNLSGPYADSANMNLVMPPIQVPDTGHLFLQFKSWHKLEEFFDYGYVFVLPEGKTNWEQAGIYNGASAGWADEEIDLSAYKGQNIKVMFNVQSDEVVNEDGWYIDDVSLSASSLGKMKKNKLGIQKPSGKLKKKAVNPKQAKPAATSAEKDVKRGTNLLPLRAQVSVAETGKSVYSDPASGKYILSHKAGSYTLKAEAYGYQPKTESVSIQSDQTAQADFMLEKMPSGTLKGTIINQSTGEPVKGATLYVIEDAAIEPAVTNDKGEYSLQAYEGSYTIKIAAKGYYNNEFSVDVKGNVTQNAELKPYIGYEGEIAYDNGVEEAAMSYFEAGSKSAVKMTLADGKEHGMLTGGLFKFWGEDWPAPGGTEFQIEVYDASEKDGSPGKKIAGPFKAEALRNGEWTKVDLSSKGVAVGKDFYLVFVQTKPDPYSPGLSADDGSTYSNRNWQYIGGSWSKADKSDGNYMIRALVDYEASVPEITSPQDKSFTNKEKLTVKGIASPETAVRLYNDEKEAAQTKAGADGTFQTDVLLRKGANRLTASSSTDRGSTDASSPVTVILDQDKPDLTIDNPKNGDKTNKETVTVKGKAADDYLKWVKVNGQKAEVKDGSYQARILLENGSNEIKVTAADEAGNKTTKKTVIDANFTAPVISGLVPGEDKILKAGESVKIAFSSGKKLDAAFVIRLPLTNARASTQNATELPLREISPGRYEGYWTATSSIKANGAKIDVIVRDDYGNETRQTAKGKLYINE
ncbi:peptidase S8 [Bacillus nakamurai]|uniref:S8 family peptidase n=1 Tax=Bacillus nakamurai TaxID=1793963 RepID=UPI0007783654|nr:S8 family peptidase [Bacillus nakamurai]KXZ14861.1 peptidase S8 [Bacillus nakamurai]